LLRPWRKLFCLVSKAFGFVGESFFEGNGLFETAANLHDTTSCLRVLTVGFALSIPDVVTRQSVSKLPDIKFEHHQRRAGLDASQVIVACSGNARGAASNSGPGLAGFGFMRSERIAPHLFGPSTKPILCGILSSRRSSLQAVQPHVGSPRWQRQKSFQPPLNRIFSVPRSFFRRGLVTGSGQMTSLDC
jgi:hypothetical protein